MKKLLIASIFLATAVHGQNICIDPTSGFTTAPQCSGGAMRVKVDASSMVINNDTYIQGRNAADSADIDVWKVDATDDTVLNCDSGDVIKLSENGTAGVTLDPSTNGFTFASPAELGTNSLTDGISALWWTNGTGKAAAVFDASHNFQLGPVTVGDNFIFLFEGNSELTMTGTAFSPAGTGGNALGSTSLGWNGLYLSDGTDKWSLVPGVNLLTLAAGADDQELKLCSGSTCNSAGGAYIAAVGDDVGGADAGGSLILAAGNNATSVVGMYNGGSLRWSIDTNGHLTQDATNGGNIVMAKADKYLLTGLSAVTTDITTPAAAPGVVLFGGYHQFIGGYASAVGPGMQFLKSRSTDGTANTVVAADDDLANFEFYGSDQTHADGKFAKGAQLLVEVDGTPGVNDIPGRFVFKVSPDGSATPAEAMRITSKGEVLVKGVAVASLPASCTPGALMRATDSNDCAAGGGDGSMCICVAAGTWALAHNY